MKKKNAGLVLLLFSFLFFGAMITEQVDAASLDEYDLESMDDYMEDEYFNLDFASLVKDIYSSGFHFENEIIGRLLELFLSELSHCIKIVLITVGIIIAGSVFKNMTGILNDGMVMKTGAFITYIAVMTMLFVSFTEGFSVVEKAAGKVMDFLYALIPTFFCAVTFTKGSITGSIMYQWTGVCISLVQVMVVKFILPLINYYVIIGIINNASEDKKFGSMCMLIKKVILYVNRTMMGIIVGMTSIKSMTVPLSDSLKNTFLKKTISVIPGIGNGVESVAQTVATTGNLIKNTIGAAGLVAVILIAVIPLLKLAAMNLVFYFLGAITEPVAEKKVIDGIHSISDGLGILQYVLCTSCIILMISIGIICMATGV